MPESSGPSQGESVNYEREVEKCFQENPHLLGKSLREIAIFFMVQGELRFSLLRETLNHKADYFLCRLEEADKDAAEEAKKKWKSIAGIYREDGQE